MDLYVILRDHEDQPEDNLKQLLNLMESILKLVCDDKIPVPNKRLLLSDIKPISSPEPSTSLSRSAKQVEYLLSETTDGLVMVVETKEFKRMEERIAGIGYGEGKTETRLEEENKKLKKEVERVKEEKREAEGRVRVLENEKNRLEEERRRLDETARTAMDERGRRVIAEQKAARLEEEIQKMRKELEEKGRPSQINVTRLERELKQMKDELERARRTEIMNRGRLKGTKSLALIDRELHTLSPTTLTMKTPVRPPLVSWRTAFTHPIDEGVWELTIRATENTFRNVMLSFLAHPLPPNAVHVTCGFVANGIGGDFDIWKGGMWRWGRQVQPDSTNKQCQSVGQTAAIRVNMSKREAKLIVDGVAQPSYFTDIPSPLCLAISMAAPQAPHAVEVLHLVRLRERERTEWKGTEAINTFDRTIHRLTPTTLEQEIKRKAGDWQTAFTHPVDEGVWELTIRVTRNVFKNVMVGLVPHPLPPNATQHPSSFHTSVPCVDFELWSGAILARRKTAKKPGTNVKCERAGQTVTVRVDLDRREGWLIVDEKEQPGTVTNIPCPLCFGISTGSDPTVIEVLRLKRI
ncbi:hypothetical protein BLNAU_14222 [Blattamonas nauphoetae]|uniref:Uncharacterized protein n=1 Tax=Blattamonas nauphoetae TaxID=2049346 RepID=A0ABQ9XHB1_9EUKA|nr:hypothetical protein BLNAU_14222 [Blattamonas nauphoetae]